MIKKKKAIKRPPELLVAAGGGAAAAKHLCGVGVSSPRPRGTDEEEEEDYLFNNRSDYFSRPLVRWEESERLTRASCGTARGGSKQDARRTQLSLTFRHEPHEVCLRRTGQDQV